MRVSTVALLTLTPVAACASRDASTAPADAGVACFAAPSATDAATVDDASAACTPNATGPSQRLDFVVTQFTFNGHQTPSPTARPVFGFDLDGVSSFGRLPAPLPPPHCGHGDYASARDDDQNRDARGRPCRALSEACLGGVDNSLPALVDSLAQLHEGVDPSRDLNEMVFRGLYAMVIRVDGVDGEPSATLCDPSVTVRVYRGVPLTPSCAPAGTPGLRYAIDAASLLDPSDPSSARFSFPGAIVDGRVRVSPRRTADPSPTLALPFPLAGHAATLNLYNAVLRFDVVPPALGADGNLGGIVRDLDVVAAVNFLPFFRTNAGWLVPTVSMFMDIAWPLGSPRATCSFECGGGAMSVGLGFRTARTELTDDVMPAPPAEHCAP